MFESILIEILSIDKVHLQNFHIYKKYPIIK